MQTRLEGDILKAVMSTDIQVDREELTRALRYDRDQYDRGFADGYMTAKQALVLCKDCKHYKLKKDINNQPKMFCTNTDALWYDTKPDMFCCFGERKDDA